MDRGTRGRLVGGLLATSSMAALLTGGFTPEAQAAACSTTLGPGAVSGCTNTGVLTKINVNGADVTGNVSNSGTISPNGISLTGSTINGGIIAGGTVAGGVSVDGTSKITAGAVSIAVTGSTFAGGIANSGFINGSNNGIAVTAANGSGTHSFAGGITNSGTVSAGGQAILVKAVGTGAIATFSGNISNIGSGAIDGNSGIQIKNVIAFTGNISNAGTITAVGASGVVVGSVSTFTGGIINTGGILARDDGIAVGNDGAFTGGITNSSTISALDDGITVGNLSMFAGGVSNSGSLIAHNTGILVGNTSTASGGITNSGTISAGGSAILVGNTGTFSGGIVNSGAAAIHGNCGIALGNITNFSGGITNAGNISVAVTGIKVGNISTFAGGIVNSGTIAGTIGIVVQAGATFAGGGITNSGTIKGTGGTAINLSTATAPVTINQNNGTLVGTILFSAANGDTLTGNGTLTGSLSTAGTNATIWPTLAGTGILKITGSFTQGASSTAVFEINPTTAALLAIGTTATLAGPVKIVFDPGTYSTKTYTLITVGTSHTGTFSSLSSNAPSGVIATIDYAPANEIDLDITGGGTVGGIGGGGMVVTTNTAILGDPISLAQSGFFNADGEVFDHLDEIGSSGDGVKTALAAASPIQLAFNGGLGQLAQAGSQLPNALAQIGGWVRGIGNFQSADTQGAVAGYSANGGGFLAGIDHPWGDVTLGVAAGYSGTNIKQSDGSTGDVQTPRVMVYAHYRPSSPVMIDGVAGFAYDSIHTVRPIAALGANATENHSATEENLAVQAGYALPWQGFTIVPRIGAQYLHLAQRGFSETGASGFDLTAPTSHIDSFQPVLSISASEAFTTAGGMRIVPEMKLSYSHELLSTSQTLALTTPAGSVVPGTAITPARDTITLGPQVTAAVNNNLSLYADYKLAIGVGKSLDNIIFAGARVTF